MKYNYILPILLIPFFAIGQNTLTKEAAVEKYLANNLDVAIANKQVELAQEGATKSAVGYYPQLIFNIGGNGDLGSSSLNLRQGGEINASNNLTQVYSSSVGLNYNLYQGGQRKLRLEQLKEQAKLEDLQKQSVLQQGIIELINAYHQAAFLQSQVNIIKDQIVISQKQLDKAKLNREYGRISRAQLLNNKTLLQQDSSSLLSTQVDLRTAKRNILRLLGDNSSDLDFTLETNVEFNSEQLLAGMSLQPLSNIQIDILNQNELLLSKELDITKASRNPVLGFSSDYQYAFSDNGDGGFITTQQSSGLGFGLNLSWNIFDGGITKNQKSQLAVRSDILNLERERLTQEINHAINNLTDQRSSALNIMKLESANVELAKSNLEEVESTFEFGQANTLLLREAQLNLYRSEIQLLNSQYTAKTLELQLFQLYNALLDERVVY